MFGKWYIVAIEMNFVDTDEIRIEEGQFLIPATRGTYKFYACAN
jgi:hypothetical protein